MEKTENLSDSVGEHVDEIRQELTEKANELRETVNNFVQAKPLQSVGIAFGVGYVLSGALVSRTTARLAQIGLRFAFGGALRQLIAEVGPGLLTSALSGQRPMESATSRHKTRSSDRSQH
ncbi:MAG TPA: DUF883 C-terminal domain-containing protein [Polyangia bacterium]|jgi:hypothetical protein|nr:DUF883 C-terminal domain-containing protein [Polyangia bacterium]